MAWLRKVMDGWKFSRWMREAFDALLRARGVRACIGGVLGYVRTLARGLGMGNTPSPFPWCLGYDPFIFAVHEATGVRPPAYVDDLSALVWGPEQALAVEIFVMAAGHAAGLRVDAHVLVLPRSQRHRHGEAHPEVIAGEGARGGLSWWFPNDRRARGVNAAIIGTRVH